MSLRAAKVLLAIVVGCFVIATAYISTQIVERQEALKQVSRYNTSWLASQAVAEFVRLEQRISAFGAAGSGVDQDEVELRLDILVSRVKLLNDGEFQDFVRRDPERLVVLAQLNEAVAAAQPVIQNVQQPGAVQRALQILAPLDAKLAGLASAANRYGAERVAEDQHELVRLHWIFTSVAAGLIVCGVALIILLMWHNRLLTRAHEDLHGLTGDLRKTSGELKEANRAAQNAYAELQLRNEALQTSELELRTQNVRFDAALNNMSQGLCMVDSAEQLIVCNERFVQLFDLTTDTVVPGTKLRDLIARAEVTGRRGPETLRKIYAAQREVIRFGVPSVSVHGEPDGRAIAISHRPMASGGWVATYEDITERRRAESQIAYMAHHDALTGLANRVLFRQQMEEALSRTGRQGGSIAVLCLDLDRFKDVNDSLGHQTGDALLGAVAERLRRCVKDGDSVARLGGDEFAILQLAPSHPDDAGALAQRIVMEIGKPYRIEGQEIIIGTSVGIALSGQECHEAEEFLKQADLALYRAKADGRGTFRFFEPEMDAQLKARRALELDLHKALANGEFELFYQPQVNIKAYQITGFEALLRWHHPERGMVSPEEFIPVAEDIGLISQLGTWVMRQACKEAATWSTKLKVAVNLSPAQFRDGSLAEAVIGALAASGLSPSRLELEITESVLLQDNQRTLQTLHELRTLGVRIAMDDFGTGYSSLSYLRSFPFDKIKIDQSFVRELSTRKDCLAIVQSITALGASLGMVTTAEGVETEEQYLQLRAAGCTEAQGFFLGRPQPAAERIRSLRALSVSKAA